MFYQLNIHWVNLEPTVGAETQKLRPCVIVQSDLVNKGSRTVIVAPILPNHNDWPFAVNIIPSETNGLDKARHINLKQLRAIDISRVGSKKGKIEHKYLEHIQNCLQIIFNS